MLGFSVHLCGGGGQAAAPWLISLLQSDPLRPAYKTICYDSDRIHLAGLDAKVDLSVADQVEAILADPGAYGSICEFVAAHRPELLNAETCRYGSQTMRIPTQLDVEVHTSAIIEANRATMQALGKEGCDATIPLIVAGTGGGMGSALSVLLPSMFNNPDFRSLVADPLGILLYKPVLILADPYAMAMKHAGTKHADRIMANACATRAELARLDRHNALGYVFNLGLSNGDGAIYDTPEEIAYALALAAYHLMVDFEYLQARWVDTVATAVLTDHYSGRDVPECRVPRSERPSFAQEPQTRLSRTSFVDLDNNHAH